jgi:hypothetical protein
MANGKGELVVIGAGLPRTGTNSMYLALEELLGAPCYHMKVMMFSKGDAHIKFWQRALRRKVTPEEWKSFLAQGNFRAGVDYPISFYYKDLMRIYPNAKFILTTRSPESWYKSVKETIFLTVGSKQSQIMKWTFDLLVGKGKVDVPSDLGDAIPDGLDISMYGSIEKGQERAVKFFNDWAEEVKASVPADRLLIHEAKEGWGPLCKFLEVPVPNKPYPRVNDTQSMKNQFTRLQYISIALFYVLPAIVAGLGIGLYVNYK